ncbi:MAG TPA: Na+/H+ antiporter [Gemmatimonadales bacterium]|nr:Na+/H+ antiporter [Gemmatimonadales bacterium]
MQGLELTVVLLTVAAALRVLAGRLNVPHPVLLVLGGLALAAIPGLPRIEFEPETLFLLFVPPLLYWASLTTSLRDFRAQLWPISRYGTLVVLLTIGAVAAVAHALVPEMTWPAAFLLGAIVSPPDPVAAVAVMRSLGAPRRIVTLLEGEGLVNDATALVAYRIGVAAVVTGSFSAGHAALQFLITGSGGVAVGLGAGWLIGQVRRRTPKFPIVENTISLLTPFLAYLPADWLGLSGILAVVAVGLYLGRQGPRIVSAATRVQAESMWTMIQFLLESFIFMLVGLELPYVLRALRSHTLAELVGYGAIVALTAIVVRLVYTFVAVLLLRMKRRRRGEPAEPSWREATFVGWTAMRGGDSLVIALALPLQTAAGRPFPARELIIFLTFAVIFDTLVLQGLTLKPLLRRLRLEDGGELDVEEAHARRVAAEVGLQRLEAEGRRNGVEPEVVSFLRRKYAGRVDRWSARDRHVHGAEDAEHRALANRDGSGAEREATGYRRLRAAMIDAERRAIIDLRDEGVIGDEVMRRVQRDLDLETMLLESGEDDAPESPYDTS